MKKKKKTSKNNVLPIILNKKGNKNDAGKPPVTQLLRQFPSAIKYVSKCSEYGHKEYGEKENEELWDNWRYVEEAKFRYKQAAGRHFLEENGKFDEGSGLYHIAHCIWNLLAELQFQLEEDFQKNIKNEGHKFDIKER